MRARGVEPVDVVVIIVSSEDLNDRRNYSGQLVLLKAMCFNSVEKPGKYFDPNRFCLALGGAQMYA